MNSLLRLRFVTGCWLGFIMGALSGVEVAVQAEENVPSADAIKAAVTKSLPLLEQGAKGSMEMRKQCFTCHNQGPPIMALTAARARGFAIDAEHLQTQVKFIADFLGKHKQEYLEGKGQGGQATTAGYALWTLENGGWQPDETTAAVTEYLLLYQKDHDHWETAGRRPPSEQSSFTSSFVALRGLKAFGTSGQRERIDTRLSQVREWLLKTSPVDTEDRVFRLLALREVDAPEDAVRDASHELQKTQREDDGWSQLADLQSDAYATGSALVAMHQAGGMAIDDPAYRKGLSYLISTQKDDGSWQVTSRSKPFQTYFESGYPHSKDQFISIAGAGWATTALALSLPKTPVTDQTSVAQPVSTSGLIVSHGGAALREPGDESGQPAMYGLGFVFQVGPRTAAISCNVRTVGTGHWDFENGTDIVVFDDLSAIGQQKPIVVVRNEEYQSPATGKKRVAVTYPGSIGFVPREAKRPDGSEHPDAGTGFGFQQVLCFDLNNEGYFTMDQVPAERWCYVHQFAYDGRDFRVVKTEKKLADAPLKTEDGAWTITAPGMSAAIPDDGDLLLPMVANNSKQTAAGVSRWRRTDGDWRPVAFHDVSDGSEPSLVRDLDGKLLYSVREDVGQTVRVWRSRDNGLKWDQVLHVPNLRTNAPVVLNQAADGTPYIAANHPDSFRAKICLWPLNGERTGCGPAVVARDCVREFGPPPAGTTWFADHPTATTVLLADGRWHNLLAYRLMAFSTMGVGGETIMPQTGCYIERVSSAGPVRPAWQF